MVGSMRGWVLLLSLIALAAPASAQTVEGALRLHLETGAFGVTRITRERADGSSASGTLLSIGPTNAGFGFGAGYGVSENVLVGANLSLYTLTASDDDSDSDATTATRLTVGPYLELLFGEGGTRPFVGVQPALGYTKVEDSHTTTLGLMGMVGAHVFLSDGGSFDVSARPFVETLSDEDDDTTTSYGLLVTLGVSAWSR